uniref:Immunoglobulin domain-containing protein n=1 Tax=Gallus gallus TaxID=9031 RepID=A0A8V0XSW7_CHICK
MAPMVVALILGWRLVAASRAQQLPRPSLSLHPSQGVSLANNVTLRCHLPRLAAWVWLYQERGWSYNKGKEKEQNAAEFSFVSTQREHAGRYRCQYRVSWSVGASEKSDPVELVLTDHSYSPPSISIHPEQCVEMGTNITIRCWNKDYGAAFLLHKDGSSDPLQRQDPSGGGAANFTLLVVTPADSGTYRCSYRPRGYPFVSSPLGDSVMLEVTTTAAPLGGSEPPHLHAPHHGWVAVSLHPVCMGVVAGNRDTQTPGPHRCRGAVPGQSGDGTGEGLCGCTRLWPRSLLCHRCPQPLDTER